MRGPFKRYRTKRRVKIAVGVIVDVDNTLKALHSSRDFRKQVWSDFIRRQDGRDAVVRLLMRGNGTSGDAPDASRTAQDDRSGVLGSIDKESAKGDTR